MKSQSTITGRLFGKHSVIGVVGSEINYLLRRHKDVLGVISIVLLMAGVMGLIFWYVNNHNDQKMIQYAKLYHYAVGSKQSCNLVGAKGTKGTNWVPCTITAVSKDNRYYTATFEAGDGDGHHSTTTTYKFQNQYVGNP